MIRLNVFVHVGETNREKAIEAAKELTACSLNFTKTSYNHKKRLYLPLKSKNNYFGRNS